MANKKLADETIINPCTLKFIKGAVENDFQKANKEKQKKDNVIISVISAVSSFIVMILLIAINQINSKLGTILQIQLQTVDPVLLAQILSNNSNITSDFVHERKFFLVNLTSQAMGHPLNQTLISTSNTKYAALADSIYNGMGNMIITIILFTTFTIFSFLSCCCNKNKKCQKILFCFLMVLFSLPYNVLSGVLYVCFQLNAEFMYFPIAVQIILFSLIVFKYNSDWFLFAIFNLTGLVIEIIIYLSIINSTTAMVSYTIYYIIIKLILISISYSVEKKIKNEFYLKRNLRNERDYVVDLVSNIDLGFITYNKNILFVNEAMKSVIVQFTSTEKTESFYGRLVDRYFFNEKVQETELLSDRVYLTNSDKKLLTGPEFYAGKVLETNVKSETKQVLVKILRNLKEINQSLPEELISTLTNKKLNSKSSNEVEESNLDLFYDYIIKKDGNYSTYTKLGVVNITSEDKQINKKYQLLFRLASHNYNDEFLEIIFSELNQTIISPTSNGLENNLKSTNTAINSVSLYNKKIANEIQVPIESIYELSKFILVESQQENCEENIPMIVDSAQYINKLCRVSKELLKDYNLIKETKFSCKKCTLAHLKSCPKCGIFKFCSKCTVCRSCEKKKETSFDLPETIDNIIDNLRIISKHEKCYDSPYFLDNIDCEEDCETNLITTNKEILCSALFNILFYAYRNSKDKSEIKLDVRRSLTTNNNINTLFEISEISTIDEDYVKLLDYNAKPTPQDETAPFDERNQKYFEIYVAFYLVKQLGSFLKIDSTSEGTIYSFLLSEPKTRTNEFKFPKLRPKYYQRNEEDPEDNIAVDFIPKVTKFTPKEKKEGKQVDPRNYKLVKTQPSFTSYKQIKNEYMNTLAEENEINNNSINESEIEVKIRTNNKRVLLILSSPSDKDNISGNFRTLKNTCDTNYEILEANNGFEALNIAYDIVNNKQKLDFILVDETKQKMQLSTFCSQLKEVYLENNAEDCPLIVCLTDSYSKQKEIISKGVDSVLKRGGDFNDFKDIFASSD